MRFSKAPLIATLMAVALSLLIILPALAENTNGEVTQGRGTDSQLIVGVYDPNGLDSRADRTIPARRQPQLLARPLSRKTRSSTGSCTSRTGMTPPKTRVPSRAVTTRCWVTQVGPPTPVQCLSVTVKNTRSGGGSIKLALVPATGGTPAAPDGNRYYQNYFRVADADFESTDPGAIDLVNSDGRFECDDGELTEVDTNAATPDVVDSQAPADILARDGDVLTITAGTWVQELHVDGAGPEFASITPPDKTIQDSSRLRIAFTVRDDGSGLRHDGEFINMPTRGHRPGAQQCWMDDQAYESEPLSDVDGASEDIAVLIAPMLRPYPRLSQRRHESPLRSAHRGVNGPECARQRRLGHDRSGRGVPARVELQRHPAG